MKVKKVKIFQLRYECQYCIACPPEGTMQIHCSQQVFPTNTAVGQSLV